MARDSPPCSVVRLSLACSHTGKELPRKGVQTKGIIIIIMFRPGSVVLIKLLIKQTKNKTIMT